MQYKEKLAKAVNESGSAFCIGIDPDPADFPPEVLREAKDSGEALVGFCRDIIDQTKDVTAAYKLNTAYFEAFGAAGFEVLEKVHRYIPDDIVTIADAKRGDVPHSAAKYKKAFFDTLGFDAITLSPLMGYETLAPFLQDSRKACYILTLTSNAGAEDFFKQRLQSGRTLSEHIASFLRDSAGDVSGEAGMVLGGTQSGQFESICAEYPGAHVLIPGIGAQQGSAENITDTLNTYRIKPLISVSRGISLAFKQTDRPWKEAIREAAVYFSGECQRFTSNYNS